jgi:hypothetical protein
MSFWEKILGKEPHCVVCGQPIRELNPHLEKGPYCSELCQRTIERLSSSPPPRPRPEQPPEE